MLSSSADPRAQSAIANWAPRMIANGIDYNDFVSTAARVRVWADWSVEWSRTAARHEAIAHQAEAEGCLRTAAEAYVAAALCHHFGKFVGVEDAAQYERANRATGENYRRAAAHLAPPAERVEVAYKGHVLPGYLRKPEGVARPPVVQVICGLDSVKEEFSGFENVFHARGLATLTIDGPGQGEAEHLPIEPAYEKVVGAAIDFLGARGDVDAGQVGAVGISLGGYYAARAAAFEPRLRATASVGGAYDFGAIFDSIPGLTRHALTLRSHSMDDGEARAFAQRLSLAEAAPRIASPFFVVFGKEDRLIPYQQAERLFAEIPCPDKRLDLHEDGNHVCNNIPYAWRPQVGDWLAARLLPGAVPKSGQETQGRLAR